MNDTIDKAMRVSEVWVSVNGVQVKITEPKEMIIEVIGRTGERMWHLGKYKVQGLKIEEVRE